MRSRAFRTAATTSGHSCTTTAREPTLRALGVEIVIGDLLDIDSVQAAMRDIDAAYFVFPINPRLLDATAYFAQAAHEAGVGAIVNLSQRTARRDSKSHSAQNHWIAERIFDWSGIPVTHLRPTLFDEWLTYDFSIGAIIDNDVLAIPFGTGRFSPIAAYDQGRVIAAVLSDPKPHAGKTYLLDGPAEMDAADMAGALSDVLGRPIRYYDLPIADFQAAAAAIPRLGSYVGQHIGAVMVDLQDGLLAGTTNTVEQLTGTAPMSVHDFVVANRDLFIKPATASV
ncbi:MAG: NAD(P)H-binding protein [Mycobacterium sp.]|uniref:NmrA family NAD(P)-binding protein n=1 Tax=Mycobacterium sp. TaxID=1785 RepID=UPI003BB0CF8A